MPLRRFAPALLLLLASLAALFAGLEPVPASAEAPVWQDDYRTTRGDHTTMVNLTASKGCEVFYEMARRRRSDRFLGVLGAYGHQLVRQIPNVEVTGHTGDMRDDVYARTRVLLMPSDYESWGRVLSLIHI